MTHIYKLSLLCFISFSVSFAAFSQKEVIETEVTYAKKLGKTVPLRNLPPAPPTDPAKLKAYKENKPDLVPNFIGRHGEPELQPGLPIGEDPVRQKNIDRSLGTVIEPTANFEGLNISLSGSGVPDVNGDVSHDHYVEAVNSTIFRVFDKEGNALGLVNANTIWSQVGFTSAGDPILLYDHEADRWFLTEFPPSSRVLIAVSETSDPLGSWDTYVFQTPSFPDYPKYSIWPEAYMLTTNEGGFPLACYAIDRAALLNGDEDVAIMRFTVNRAGFPFEVATPVNWDGDIPPPENSPALIARINDDALFNGQDRIDLWKVDIDWATPNVVTLENLAIPVAPFDAFFCSVQGFGFSCVPQPNGQGIDGIPYVIMHRAHYRNFETHESIVLNFTVDATGDNVAGIRWVELRKSGEEEWDLYQEGTFSPDTLQRFMGGIAIDNGGNIGLAYSISSADKEPSLRFTGRRSSDPLGQMTVEEFEFATGGGSLGFDRFGDYASMSVDPSDGRTFWYAGEYIQTSGSWATKIVAFNMGRDSLDASALSLVNPQTSDLLSNAEGVRIRLKNEGILPLTAFNVGYILDDGPAVVETALIDTLFSDSIYTHTFINPVDLSDIKSYTFQIFSDLPSDQNRLNDTLRKVIRKLPMRDLAPSKFTGLDVPVCDTQAAVQVLIANLGTDTVRTARIQWSLNDLPFDTLSWEGELPSGESAGVDIQLSDLVTGEYRITAIVTSLNEMDDQVAINDTIMKTFQVLTGGVQIFLELLTDRSPVETTWELADESGNVIYSGGPYGSPETLITEEFCLNPDSCYVFTIFDSFGDGLSTSGAFGDYVIVDTSGRDLAGLMNINFGEEESNQFCATFVCNISASVNVSHETSPGNNNGSFVVSQISGTGPFMFSLDSGATFSPIPLVSNLAPGDYNLLVLDGNDCTTLVPFTILPCNIEIMSVTNPESGSGAADGQISISVTGGVPPYLYSIDGGTTLLPDSLFLDLASDTFDILVRDINGCVVTSQAEVQLMTNTQNLTFGHLVKIYPNPTSGVIHIEVQGSDLSEVGVQIFNAKGQTIGHGWLARYNDKLKGSVSILKYPPGIYYFRLKDSRFDKLYQVIKQ